MTSSIFSKFAVASCAGAAIFATSCDALADSGRGIEVAVPAYVYPGDPFLNDLKDPVKTPVPPSVVIMNIGNGDADESILDADADALRQRIAANGEHVKVIGYVYTTRAGRKKPEIIKSIDRYLAPRNGSVHFDGIFFDEVPRECGPTAGSLEWRDKLREMREYVWTKIPKGSDLVVNNIGTAVFDCYLEPGHETADTFITFEDTAEHYFANASSVGWAYGWLGGNVVSGGQYVLGTQYNSSRFWHLVYGVNNSNWAAVTNTAFARYAGYVDATDDMYTNGLLNPWDQKPTFLNDVVSYAKTLGN
ncbi:spherulation-specific family 4 protein [Paraherbaspirillum soli]|uniref:Spherulation-specific family 4 protein n=1 Tax=Paraherbaspirillum soli TaxID=631222 RepID=A0ABW0M7K9_9BURK